MLVNILELVNCAELFAFTLKSLKLRDTWSEPQWNKYFVAVFAHDRYIDQNSKVGDYP